MGILDGFLSLSRNINKQGKKDTDDTQEGVISELLPELKLTMPDDDLLDLDKDWKEAWNNSEVKAELDKETKDNKNYWKGKQYTKLEAENNKRPIMDNAIFEAVETFLPQATRRNPEPLVTPVQDHKDDAVALEFAQNIKDKLADIADTVKLRLKLKRVSRHWILNLVGAGQIVWDIERDMPSLKPIEVSKLIFDPKASNDEDGYSGDRLGIYKEMRADALIDIIDADAKTAVRALITKDGKKLATKLRYVEWWTPKYTFWTMDGIVLLKRKNFHWNYEETVPGEVIVDGFGEETMGPETTKAGVNHFTMPKIPVVFLTVYSIGNKPVDETSLIGQNLSNQDLLNKRNRQMDRNIDKMNGGMVISLEKAGLDKEEATLASNALQRGGVVAIPTGTPREAIDTYQAQPLPSDVYNSAVDTRNRLRDIFGTTGISPSGVQNEDTVRGKLVIRGLDTDRIGGGITEYLEQFADDVYNWWLQMLYVYDDEFQNIPVRFPVLISVKEGSLLPKDSTTIANQAIELASANKMSLLDMYKALERPNAEELAVNAWLELNAPEILYRNDPRVREALIARQVLPPQTPTQGVVEEQPPGMVVDETGATPQVPTNTGDVTEVPIPEEV